MDRSAVIEVFSTNDGLLPDINLDFGGAPLAAEAYALIQSRASRMVSTGAHYWSKLRREECPVRFGENPAREFLQGDADPFHVIFGGLHSSSGAHIPDLGVFILASDYVALDYRMGPEWDEAAIVGLFELIRDVSNHVGKVKITHEGSIYDQDGTVLSTAFHSWVGSNRVAESLSQVTPSK
jgi:hypothetical protein